MVEGTVLVGDITTPADFRLDGQLTGNIIGQGKIVIGPKAIVRGDIRCQAADIEGDFQGNLQVTNLLSIKATASIHGHVICEKLAVEPGARFTATCEMRAINSPLDE